MLLVLTWAAGVIDAVSYLGLGRVFTAMMTGNTVLLALAIGQGEPAAVLRSALALIGFSAGAASGALIGARDPSRGEWPAVVTGALAVEAVILGAFAIVWQVTELARTAATTYLLIGLSGLAMGVQSAAVRRLGVPGVATTYITGTLTTLMADLTGRIRAPRSSPRTRSPGEPTIGLLAAVFVVYAFGALTGSLLQSRSPTVVTWLPLIAVAGVVLAASAIRGLNQARNQVR